MGFGNCPFGQHPFGHGCATVTLVDNIFIEGFKATLDTEIPNPPRATKAIEE